MPTGQHPWLLGHVDTSFAQEEIVAWVRRRSSAFSRGRSRFRGVSGQAGHWEARIGTFGERKNVSRSGCCHQSAGTQASSNCHQRCVRRAIMVCLPCSGLPPFSHNAMYIDRIEEPTQPSSPHVIHVALTRCAS